MRTQALIAAERSAADPVIPVTLLKCCARCLGDHLGMKFSKLTNPSKEWTHWTMCPTLNEPIMLAFDKTE